MYMLHSTHTHTHTVFVCFFTFYLVSFFALVLVFESVFFGLCDLSLFWGFLCGIVYPLDGKNLNKIKRLGEEGCTWSHAFVSVYKQESAHKWDHSYIINY